MFLAFSKRATQQAAIGTWTQTCDHLTETMRIGMDGDEPKIPWFQRKVFDLLLGVILSRRWMASGITTIPRLEPADHEEDNLERVELCLATLAEAQAFPGPLENYPLCDTMTLEKWKLLMVIHAQHHLGFLKADD